MRQPKRPVKHVDDLRETEIEAYGGEIVEYVYDGIAYKFTSPGRPSVPDRLYLFPIPPEHREIVSRYVRLIEYKAHGEKPTEPQLREHGILRTMGFAVGVIDSPAGVEDVLLGPFTNHRKVRPWQPADTASKSSKKKSKRTFDFLEPTTKSSSRAKPSATSRTSSTRSKASAKGS